jgi:polyphosphate glucokinase
MNVLVIDVGGSNVKILATDQTESRRFPSGPTMTPQQMVSEVKKLAADFAAAFGYPVKILNDAAMQALGSYQGGEMLFLGLGTGLGSALVTGGVVVPMELAHLPYKRRTYEDYVGLRGLQRLGRKKWQHHVEYTVKQLIAAFHPDEVVLGGGNIKKLTELPPGCRAGNNTNAFLGGFRLWEDAQSRSSAVPNKEQR